MAENELAARLRHAFNVFDVDKSGTLSAAELRAVLTRPGGGQPMSEEDASQLLKEFDTRTATACCRWMNL